MITYYRALLQACKDYSMTADANYIKFRLQPSDISPSDQHERMADQEKKKLPGFARKHLDLIGDGKFIFIFIDCSHVSYFCFIDRVDDIIEKVVLAGGTDEGQWTLQLSTDDKDLMEASGSGSIPVPVHTSQDYILPGCFGNNKKIFFLLNSELILIQLLNPKKSHILKMHL